MHEIKALHIKSLSLPMPAGSGEPSPKPASVHRHSFIYLWQKYYVIQFGEAGGYAGA